MFKNLITTLTRFRAASVMNIIGLSVAYAAFLLIFMQVRYQYSYGTDDPNYERIYRLESSSGDGQWSKLIDTKIIDYLADNESAVEGVAVFDADRLGVLVSTEPDAESSVPFETLCQYYDISKAFQFDMAEGRTPDLTNKDETMIPLSLAMQLFPGESALGRTIYTQLNPAVIASRRKMADQKQVVGVFRDFERESVLSNAIYISPKYKLPSSNNYVLLRDGSDTSALLASYRRNFKIDTRESSNVIRMTRCDETYFLADIDKWSRRSDVSGSKTTADLLLAICSLIVLIALINYVNFSTAMVPQRLRGLNVRAVMGLTRGRMRLMLIVESLGLASIAYFVALLIIGTLNDTSFVRLLSIPDTSLSANLSSVLIGGVLAVVMGVIAGIYPSYFSTRFETALVLKGNGALSPGGRGLRTVLIGFQYVVSMALIIAALFVMIQNHYLRNTPLGFDKSNVVEFNMSLGDNDQASADRFKEQLLRNPAIESVTFTRGKLGQGFVSSMPISPNGVEPFDIKLDAVEPNFLEVMDIPMIAGRNFRESDLIDGLKWYDLVNGNAAHVPAVIVTRTAQRIGNIQIDSIIDGRYRVVGVCEDLHYSSLREAVEPFGFVVTPNNWRCYVRINPVAVGGSTMSEDDAMEQVMAFINSEYDRLENTRERFTYKMLEDSLNEQYAKEDDLALLITMFTILAIIISLVGVFGLVLFDTQYRRKEIGLRKVHGASVGQVLGMFGRSFILLVVACFVIAAPFAWWGVSEWLAEFAYRTPMHWWVFALALLIVLSVTIITVVLQSWRTATTNPVEALKSE